MCVQSQICGTQKLTKEREVVKSRGNAKTESLPLKTRCPLSSPILTQAFARYHCRPPVCDICEYMIQTISINTHIV